MTDFNKRIEELADKQYRGGDVDGCEYDAFIAGANAARELMQEKLDVAADLLDEYLKKELCYETSCPYPCRAMCSNKTHKRVRDVLNKIKGGKE